MCAFLFGYTQTVTPGSPWNENFENAGSIPTGWVTNNLTGVDSFLFQNGDAGGAGTSNSAFQGSYNAIFYGGTYSAEDAELISPDIDVSGVATNGAELVFHYANEDWGGDQDTLELYYRLTNASAWVLLATYNSSEADWIKETVSLPGVTATSTTYGLRFRGSSNWGYAVVIDSLTVQEQPSCFDPLALTSSAVTSSTATIAWTAPVPAPTSYEYDYSTTQGAPSGAGTPSTPTSANLTGLTASTTYYYYVRSNCGIGGFSAWVEDSFTTACNSIVVTPTMPLCEGFENGGAIPSCWSSNVIVGNDWTFAAGAGNGGTVTTAFAGSYNANYSGGSAANTANLDMPPLDLSALATNGAQLAFYYANEEWAGDQDTLRVYYRTSATGTWTLLQTYNSTVAAWTYETITLPSVTLTSTDYWIRFEGSNDWGRGVVLDSVCVEEAPSIDMQANGLTSPVQGCFSAAETVTVEIENNSGSTIDFSIDNCTVSAWTTAAPGAGYTGSMILNTGILASGATQSVTMPTTYDMTASGTYTFSAAVSVTGDANNLNDTTSTPYNLINVASQATPYCADFTAGVPTGWGQSGMISPGTTHGNPGGAIYDNQYSAGTTYSWFLTDKYSIMAGDTLSFDYRIVNWSGYPSTATTMGGNGKLRISVSTDCGATFTALDSIDSTSHVVSTSFAAMKYPLTTYIGSDVFILVENFWDGINDYYVDYDNVCIGEPNDVEVDSILSPPSGGCPGPAEMVQVRILNNSSAAIDMSVTNMDVGYIWDGGTPVSETIITGLIPGNGTYLHTFAGTVDASAIGTHTIQAYTAWTLDDNVPNDSLAILIIQDTVYTGICDSITATSTAGLTDWRFSDGNWNVFGTHNNGGTSSGLTRNQYGGTGAGWFILPKVDISADSILKFDYRVVNWSGYPNTATPNIDGIHILASDDCGVNWDTLYSIDTSNHTETTQWTDFELHLNEWGTYANNEIFIAITCPYSTGDYYVDFDNFCIESESVDVGILAASTVTDCEGNLILQAKE